MGLAVVFGDVGLSEGAGNGAAVGLPGATVGFCEGFGEGAPVGRSEGCAVGRGDGFGEGASMEWHPEDRVWEDLNEFYVPRLCEDA